MDPKAVLITGASAGIGAALARRLAAAGHSLVLVARRADRLAQLAAECGPRALAAPADVASREQMRAAIAAGVERFGALDALVLNAGRGITRLPSELDDADLDEMMRVNVHSVLYGFQEALPHFRARGRGQWVAVSSLLGRMPYVPARSAYCGAKHFLNALVATFRAELAASDPGLTVGLVSPGPVATEFGVAARHGGPDSRTLPGAQSADEVAAVIERVLESGETDVYTAPWMKDKVDAHLLSLGA